ncbi:MAG: Exodeoxyribonuclease VII large subunit, partial [uncultured Craurococcus sp.]
GHTSAHRCPSGQHPRIRRLRDRRSHQADPGGELRPGPRARRDHRAQALPFRPYLPLPQGRGGEARIGHLEDLGRPPRGEAGERHRGHRHRPHRHLCRPLEIPARHRPAGIRRRGRPPRPDRDAAEAPSGGGAVRCRAQAPPAHAAGDHRRGDERARRRHPGHPHHHRPALPAPHPALAGRRAGPGRRRADRRRHPRLRQAAGGDAAGRDHRRPRRRQPRGPDGLQRGGRRPRRGREPDPPHQRRRPRDGHDADRLRLRPPRPHPHGRGGDGDPRPHRPPRRPGPDRGAPAPARPRPRRARPPPPHAGRARPARPAEHPRRHAPAAGGPGGAAGPRPARPGAAEARGAVPAGAAPPASARGDRRPAGGDRPSAGARPRRLAADRGARADLPCTRPLQRPPGRGAGTREAGAAGGAGGAAGKRLLPIRPLPGLRPGPRRRGRAHHQRHRRAPRRSPCPHLRRWRGAGDRRWGQVSTEAPDAGQAGAGDPSV